MAAAPQCSQVAAQAALDAMLANLSVGGIAGYIKIFTVGAGIPANTEAADAGTLLAQPTLSVTAFPASATNASPRGAKATANAITADTNAANTGTTAYFRAYDKNGVCVMQGTCGTSAADMILNTTSIVATSTVSVTSWTVTQPDGG